MEVFSTIGIVENTSRFWIKPIQSISFTFKSFSVTLTGYVCTHQIHRSDLKREARRFKTQRSSQLSTRYLSNLPVHHARPNPGLEVLLKINELKRFRKEKSLTPHQHYYNSRGRDSCASGFQFNSL